MIKKSVLELVGKTPILNIEKTNKNIFIKLEGKNPGGSVKDRAVLGMIEDAEKNGRLTKESVIVEATSGNTGIAIAMISKLKGYKSIIIMPDSMSHERRALIKAYGAELILTPGVNGMKGSVDEMNRLIKENKNYIALGQFDNKSNPRYHYNTTGVEIYEDIPDVDIFVTGVGTSGTLTGVGSYLKEKNPNIMIVAVEPQESQVLGGGVPGPHKIQGIGANFVPGNYDEKLIDEVMPISSEDAIEALKVVADKEGLLIGISSGANISAALKLSEKYPDKKIVTISPDGAEKYISMGIYD